MATNDPYAYDNAYFGGHPAVRQSGSVAYKARKHLRGLIGDPDTEKEADEKKPDDEAGEYGIFKNLSGYENLRKK